MNSSLCCVYYCADCNSLLLDYELVDAQTGMMLEDIATQDAACPYCDAAITSQDFIGIKEVFYE